MNNTNVCATSENIYYISAEVINEMNTTAREKLLIYTVVDNWNEFWSPIISKTVKINRRCNHIVHFVKQSENDGKKTICSERVLKIRAVKQTNILFVITATKMVINANEANWTKWIWLVVHEAIKIDSLF